MKQYLRENQIQEMQREKRFLEATLADPMARLPGPKGDTLNVGILQKQLSSLTRDLDTQTPHDMNADERDKVGKRSAELKKQIIDGKQGMPSFAEMRKNPSGAVGKHINFEGKPWDAGDGSGSRSNKVRILEWKNCQRLLNKGNEDPDIANINQFRPHASTLNFDDAQIPGRDYDIPSPTFTQNFDRAFGKVDDDGEVEKLRTELELLRAKVADREVPAAVEAPVEAPEKKAKGWSPERRAEHGRKIMEAKARKAAERADSAEA